MARYRKKTLSRPFHCSREKLNAARLLVNTCRKVIHADTNTVFQYQRPKKIPFIVNTSR